MENSIKNSFAIGQRAENIEGVLLRVSPMDEVGLLFFAFILAISSAQDNFISFLGYPLAFVLLYFAVMYWRRIQKIHRLFVTEEEVVITALKSLNSVVVSQVIPIESINSFTLEKDMAMTITTKDSNTIELRYYWQTNSLYHLLNHLKKHRDANKELDV